MRYQNRALCCSLAFFLAASVSPGRCQTLLRMEGESLSGKQIVLPNDAHGKIALLVVGFSKKGGDATREWQQRIRKDFGTDQRYVIYPIAVLEDAPRFVRGMIKSGMRRDVPPAEQDRFVILTHGEADLKTFVGYSAPDDAYVLLIDSHGEVRWRGHGIWREQEYAALRDAAKQIPVSGQ